MMMHDAPDYVSSVSFLMHTGQIDSEIKIKADVAGSSFLGFGSLGGLLDTGGME